MNALTKFRLDEQVILLTGGAGLLGREFALALAEVKAKVVLWDINPDVEQIAQEISDQTNNDDVLGQQIDICDKTVVKQAVEQITSLFGRIDGLVNNAAVNPKFEAGAAKEHTFSFETYPLKLWQQSLDVNLTGMFICTQVVAPILVEQHKGSVVNIASIYGIVGPDQRLYEHDDPEIPQTYKPVDYSVTKSAVYGFTKYLAAYYGSKNIRVNALTLGGVFNNHDEGFVSRYNSRVPLGRMADKIDYSNALVFCYQMRQHI